MALSIEAIIIFIVIVVVISVLFLTISTIKALEFLLGQEERRRVVPLNRLIRLQRLRQEMHSLQIQQHYVMQEQVNEQINHCIVVINPDNTIQLGCR